MNTALTAWAAGAITLLSATTAMAADYTMRIAAGASSTGNICNNYLDVWAEEVKEKSGGRIDYKMYCDGTLARMGNGVDRVEQGVADVAWDVPAAYGARFAAFNVIGVPGLYTDPEPASGALWKSYEKGELGEVTGVKLLWVQAVNNNSWFMAKAPASYTDLNGTKIGMGSQIRAKMIEAMGGVPVALKVPEYYQAMSKGAVSGLMSTAGAVFDFGIQELLTEIYEAPFGGGLTFVVMNSDFYDKLPDDLKAVIDDTTGYGRSRWASAYLRDVEAHDTENLKGVTIRKATEEEAKALQTGIDAGRNAYLASDPANADYLASIEASIAAELTN